MKDNENQLIWLLVIIAILTASSIITQRVFKKDTYRMIAREKK